MNLPTCISSNRKIRYTVCFVVLVALLVIFFTISVCAGSVQISISDILRQFRGAAVCGGWPRKGPELAGTSAWIFST